LTPHHHHHYHHHPTLTPLGILNWVRRCTKSWQDGRFVLEQKTNTYAVLPATKWRGYKCAHGYRNRVRIFPRCSVETGERFEGKSWKCDLKDALSGE
jgi:hypothetical protein